MEKTDLSSPDRGVAVPEGESNCVQTEKILMQQPGSVGGGLVLNLWEGIAHPPCFRRANGRNPSGTLHALSSAGLKAGRTLANKKLNLNANDTVYPGAR